MSAPIRHIAEFNIGILRHDWDDPRIADFVNGLDRVNALAHRSPGFVWMLGNDDMEAAQLDAEGVLGGHPRTASTLSVWESADALGHFVWNTVHRQYYARRGEWYDDAEQAPGPRMVLWHVDAGHRPTIAEAKARLDHLAEHGPTDHAFGWDAVKAQGWQAHRCGEAA
ncbi:DUF3291 domain-containing protein [Pseudooceanicola nanhaiensis]|uniref:DUF3291 domain-containing protein n=1 Tax=Pseudooceanicola nanhaiensis TaxID=375761 RepID=UPI0035136B4D